VVCEASKSRGGSRTEEAGAPQPLGRSSGLTAAAIRRVEVEEIGRLGDHRAGSFAFDETRWFEIYRTDASLVKHFS
jgi:hypothetical protein